MWLCELNRLGFVSLWKQLLNYYRLFVLNYISIYYLYSIANIAFMQKNHRRHSFGISLHVYIGFCGMTCEYGCVLMLAKSNQQKRRSHRLPSRRSSLKVLIVRVWIPVGCLWRIDGICAEAYFCSAAVYSLLALRGSLSCKLDHKVKTLICYSN